MADRFEDHRGVIQDILGPVDAVTHIYTKANAIRGNHVHHKTIQYTWILKGRLLIVTDSPKNGRQRNIYGPGEMAVEEPGVAHAWLAIEDTEVLVFTKGPRSGEDYETDTVRLEVPIL